ncbi:putative Phosphatase 2C family protein [Melia azedarach]|uniref:Phosphatase 2C family protein n=1 Tax=Melia azedarach TaxID=155640 RepID=A0ACC1XI91_MELAZ|nr:putative Phosphatase 2C family protein [Melia azedarach]
MPSIVATTTMSYGNSKMETNRIADKENLSSSSSSSSSSSVSLKRKRPPKIEIPNVLQEIQRDKLKFKDFTPQDDSVCFSGIGVAVFSLKGKKKFMEDTHKIVSCLHGNSNKSFFGVYDGHGGKKAAEFVAENLHTNIFEMMKNCAGDKEDAVKAGYLKTDEEFLRQGLVSGACCVTAFIEGQDVVVSNLGDCRAVLCRGGVAETLTTDHKAEREDEQRRIENKGGYVEFHRGAWRVHGILSVSRSIGDAHLKNWVPAEPDTKILHFTSDMEFLVLASDGFWDEVGNQEAVDTVKRLLAGKTIGPSDISKENGDGYGCVNVSPSSKIRRVSLVKQPKETCQSPRCKKTIDTWKDREDDFASELGSPPSKSRRISIVKKINVKTESCNQENSGYKKSPASAGLMAACKELTNLAVSRGSLDDITVMIIDLNRFRCNS